MQDASPASHYTAHHDERASGGSILDSSVSSIHSRSAEATYNESPHAANGSVEAAPRQAGHGIAQNRPDDLDSLQETPSDWEGQEDNAQNRRSGNRPVPFPTSWQPLWLRRSTLIGMAASLAILAAVILGLYIISARQQGLGSSASTDGIVYLWK